MPNWLGDTVMALPVLRSIRAARPLDRLAVLAPRGPAAILRSVAEVDRVLVREGLARDALRLRAARFDEAWILPNSFRSAVAPFLARVPTRVGFATDRRRALLTDALLPPPGTSHQLRDYDALLRSREIPPDPAPPTLHVPAAARERAAAALHAAGLVADERLALLAPGSAGLPTKRWPPESYAALADRLAELGFSVALVIGPREEPLARQIRRLARQPVAALGLDLDALELAALLGAARVVVSNDSGPMHLAAAVGSAVVALFGPTDPGRTGPVAQNARVLDRYVFCSPCYLERCPYGHECMKEIAVEDVLRAITGLVGQSQ